jgi:nucleotide-binding universal stress UspA family protein
LTIVNVHAERLTYRLRIDHLVEHTMSAIKSILFHMDGSARCPARLQIALHLARRHEAELTAMYAVTPHALQYPNEFAIGTETAVGMNQSEAGRLARAKAVFDKAVDSSGQRATWAVAKDVLLRDFTRRACYADLLVLGQRDPNEGPQAVVPPAFVESVVIDSGKPALVIPHIGATDPVGRVALVAWKETRESARALTAAMPLLQRAERVEVAMWGELGSTQRREPTDVEAYLQKHGVKARIHRQGDEAPQIGEYLLSLVADVSAELLVMGCYGHSRARELILGGTTRTVLNSMTVPVLMAH